MSKAKTRFPKGKVPPTMFEVEKEGDAETPRVVKSEFRAKQSFKHECDINRIIDKAKRTGVLAHVNKNAEFYADMTDFDYEDARNKIAEADSAFYELDSETRREFENNPAKFRAWIADKTPEEIVQRLPQLAEPGTQMVDLSGGTTDKGGVINESVSPTEADPPVAPTGDTETSTTGQ